MRVPCDNVHVLPTSTILIGGLFILLVCYCFLLKTEMKYLEKHECPVCPTITPCPPIPQPTPPPPVPCEPTQPLTPTPADPELEELGSQVDRNATNINLLFQQLRTHP